VPGMIGITTDLKRLKKEHEKNFKNLQKWKQIAGPFYSIEEAQKWKEETRLKFNCEVFTQDYKYDESNALWYGYYFTHDGPR